MQSRCHYKRMAIAIDLPACCAAAAIVAATCKPFTLQSLTRTLHNACLVLSYALYRSKPCRTCCCKIINILQGHTSTE
jgi:hypothetical protein